MNHQPLPSTQREVLQLAAHGDVSLLKGVSSPRKALVTKGLLDAEFKLTAEGSDQLDAENEAQAPMPFVPMASILGSEFHKFAHVGNNVAMNQGYGVAHWIGATSADGRTCYVAKRFAGKATDEHEVVATIASTVPSEFREFFGMEALR